MPRVLAPPSFSQPLSISTRVAKKGAIPAVVVGGRGGSSNDVVLTNVLQKKDDLLWLQVPD